jgi:hypothetical protein
LFDEIMLNSSPIAEKVLRRYRDWGARPVVSDMKRLRGLGLRVARRALLASGDVIRHDPDRLARAIQEAYLKWNARRAGRPT